MKMGASDFKAKHGPSRFRRNNRARRTRVGRDADPEGFRDLATRLPIDVAQHQHGRSAASNSSRTGSPVSADSRRRPVSAAVLSFMFASERMLRFTLIRLVRPYLEGAIVEPRTAAECFSKNSQRSANG